MRFIYVLYQICFGLPVVFILTAITAITTTIGCTLGNAEFWAYWPSHYWSWLVIKVLFIPVHIEGRQNINPKTSYVFVANHQGFFDIFLIYAHLGHNLRWMMKKEIKKMFLIGKACESAGQIFVDKSGPKAIQRTYNQAREMLKGGASVVIFPEGSRTHTGQIGTFRKGAFQLANELQLPVVPLTIDGSFDILPRSASTPIVNWHPLRLTIHQPIQPRGKSMENELAIMHESYDTIQSALPANRRNLTVDKKQ